MPHDISLSAAIKPADRYLICYCLKFCNTLNFLNVVESELYAIGFIFIHIATYKFTAIALK